MDNNEQRNDNGIQKEPDRQIQLVVNRPADNETTIDLGNVFYNMKRRRRLFACVLVLCLLVGIVAPLLMYQFTKPFLTVSSVYADYILLPFEDKTYCAVREFDRLLTTKYGDYMTPPPVEERVAKHLDL